VFIVQVSVDDPSQFATSDTSYSIKGNLPPTFWSEPYITVTAVDSAYLAYQVDTLATSLGLSGAKGVYTAMSRSSTVLNMGQNPALIDDARAMLSRIHNWANPWLPAAARTH
jgi:hypothetical protein